MHQARDLALIKLVGIIALASIAATTALAINGDVPAEAAFGPIVSAIALAGVAIGRLSGTSAGEPS